MTNDRLSKRKQCSKKIIPKVASKIRHPRISPMKIIYNSEEISNAIYNRLGDNALDKDVDNALIEIITGCSIGQDKVLGFDCSKITSGREMSGKREKFSEVGSVILTILLIGLVIFIIFAILTFLAFRKVSKLDYP